MYLPEILTQLRKEFSDAFDAITYEKNEDMDIATWDGGPIQLNSIFIGDHKVDTKNLHGKIISKERIESLEPIGEIKVLVFQGGNLHEDLSVSQKYGSYSLSRKKTMFKIRDYLSTLINLTSSEYNVPPDIFEKYLGGLIYLQPFNGVIHTVETEEGIVMAIGLSYSSKIQDKEVSIVQELVTDKMGKEVLLVALIRRIIAQNRNKPIICINSDNRPYTPLLLDLGFECVEHYGLYEWSNF